MAGVAGIIDPDPRTRQVFLEAVRGHFDKTYDGSQGQATVGGMECHWRVCRSAPISAVRRGPVAAWVLGHIDRTDVRRQTHAEQIADHLEKHGPAGLACQSGYFLAVTHCAGDYYIVADRMGLFPCYYAVKDGVLTLGSSSCIPVLHPDMPRRLNLKGVLGHLLCLHEVLGEPLWQGCRRLGAGEILHFSTHGLRIIRESPFPVGDAYFGLPYEALLDRAHEAMMEAFEQYRGRPVSVLFSGGLDSRLIAGYLGLQGAQTPTAYTLGEPADQEFRCARRACRTLHWRQVLVPMEFDLFPSLADRQIATEQLSNGINTLSAWRFTGAVTNATAPMITGAIGDSILGGESIPWAYDPATRKYSFDTLFRRCTQGWGLPPATLCRLFPGPDIPRLIAEIIAQLRHLYESLPGYDFQQAEQYMLLHRMRFHVGGMLRRVAQTVWPSAPYTHDAVLRAAGGMPAAAIFDRRLQKDLLVQRFRPLAALPLDTNSTHPVPLAPTMSYRLVRRLLRTAGPGQWPRPRRETRFYYRMYDINNPGWRLLRQEAWDSYTRLSGVLHVESLRELLPDPVVPIAARDAIVDAGGQRSLLGLVLWYRRYADVLESGVPQGAASTNSASAARMFATVTTPDASPQTAASPP